MNTPSNEMKATMTTRNTIDGTRNVATLDDLAARIRAEQENVRLAARSTVEHALRAGDLLLEAKRLVQHGSWGDWLREHCDLSERSAQNYMRLARQRSNPQLTADLTIDGALKALAKPKAGEFSDADVAALVGGAAADYLPAIGQASVGTLKQPGRNLFEMFGVIEDKQHPGFYRIAHIEVYGNSDRDGGGCLTEPRRSVRGDWVRAVLEECMRHPDLFDQIEWHDHPAACWPFP